MTNTDWLVLEDAQQHVGSWRVEWLWQIGVEAADEEASSEAWEDYIEGDAGGGGDGGSSGSDTEVTDFGGQ